MHNHLIAMRNSQKSDHTQSKRHMGKSTGRVPKKNGAKWEVIFLKNVVFWRNRDYPIWVSHNEKHRGGGTMSTEMRRRILRMSLAEALRHDPKARSCKGFPLLTGIGVVFGKYSIYRSHEKIHELRNEIKINYTKNKKHTKRGVARFGRRMRGHGWAVVFGLSQGREVTKIRTFCPIFLQRAPLPVPNVILFFASPNPGRNQKKYSNDYTIDFVIDGFYSFDPPPPTQCRNPLAHGGDHPAGLVGVRLHAANPKDPFGGLSFKSGGVLHPPLKREGGCLDGHGDGG